VREPRFVSEEESVKTSPIGGGRARFALLGAAALIAIAGLVLAVGAGARSGKSVRDASYPVSYLYKMVVSGGAAKSTSAVASKNGAKFRFHMVNKSDGHKPPHFVLKTIRYRCKLDKGKARGCSSPKHYSGLRNGKHKFRVQAFYTGKGPDVAATAVKTVKFKVK
jgi:hypothetical protein